MSEALDAWQTTLERHFAELASTRKSAELPVFALEHGLDANQIAEITGLLHARLRDGKRLGRHWLVWVVYATEQGYDYDGEEYWLTFETRTPQWNAQGRRRSLRDWFWKFHLAYNGVKPTGPWAEWFTIIAWPITHAILPKDLQHQLARALYDLRYQLARLVNCPPAQVGRYVAAACDDATSRFRCFLEQEELAGRIILALLAGGGSDASLAIHGPTLRRIVTDLENVRSAREWLRDARKAVELAHRSFEGAASPGLASDQSQKPGSKPAVAGAQPPNIRPHLTLRRAGVDHWTAVLEIPTFREIADLTPDLRAFLKTTRCSVSGTNGMLPAGWLLTGLQRRVLSVWPSSDHSVVKFEKPNLLIEHLLDSEGRITTGPSWIFRIGSDGLAREVVGRLVRPGQDYIVVSRRETVLTSLLRPCVMDCAGVTAAILSVPSVLCRDVTEEIKKLELSIAQTVRIWPAGLHPRGWDGEGQTEWILGETPCFGIDHDHPIDTFEVGLIGSNKICVAAKSPGNTVFIRLPPLALGQHTLIVRAIQANTGSGWSGQQPVEGVVSLIVREPETWKPGTTIHGGLVVTVDPPEPSLDAFWEGETKLTVLGPEGRQVSGTIQLLGGSGEELVSEHVGILSLPVVPDVWSRVFAHFTSNDRDPWAYLTAFSGRLVIDGEDLGSFSIPLQRNVAPIWWVWRRHPKTTMLRLVDDTAQEEEISVRAYDFRNPARAKSIPVQEARSANGFEPPAPGGLYVAYRQGQKYSLVVSMSKVSGGLAGLLIEPDAISLPAGQNAATAVLEAIEVWSEVRLAGPFAAERRDRVLLRLRQHLFHIMCGDRWAEAERSFSEAQGNPGAAEQLARAVGGPPAFAFVLRRDAAKFASCSPQERCRSFSELANRYGVSYSMMSCEVALRLCWSPNNWRQWAGEQVVRYLEDLKRGPVLIRGARFLALLCESNRLASSSSQVRGTAS